MRNYTPFRSAHQVRSVAAGLFLVAHRLTTLIRHIPHSTRIAAHIRSCLLS
jgi:hypothetical protein